MWHRRSLVTILVVATFAATGIAQLQNPWGQGLPTSNSPGMPGLGVDTSVSSTYSGKPPKVYISVDMLPLERTMHSPRIQWMETRSSPVYCVSETPAANLIFSCWNCNSTEINDQLNAATVDKTSVVGYPAAKLEQVAINGSWHNKQLACTAFYNGPEGLLNVTVFAQLDVQFLNRPVVVTDKNCPAVNGHVFYLRGMAILHCRAEGNPPATNFAWRVNGVKVADGPMLSVTDAYRAKGIQCEAASPLLIQPKFSTVVQVDNLIPPELTGNNFREVKASTVFEPNSNRLSLDQREHRIQLSCQAKGYPKPQLFWYHRLPDNKVLNATCENYQPSLSPDAFAAQQGEVHSTCSLVFDTYYKSGMYWCMACSPKAVGDWACSDTRSPDSTISIDVTGPPVIYEEVVWEEMPNSHDVRITMSFCAEPRPDSLDGVYWLIDNERLNLGQTLNHFGAEMLTQNATYPSCQSAVLTVKPLTEDDKRKNIEFFAKNVVSETKYRVNLAALAGNGHSSKYSGGDIGLAVGLAMVAIAVVVCIVVIFCWVRRVGCFKGYKISKQQKPANQQKKYPINIIPEIARSAVQKERSPVAVASPPNNFYKPPEPTYPPPYSRPETREGINYAELDLVKDAAARRPVVSNVPVEYTRLQMPVKPATSSIV